MSNSYSIKKGLDIRLKGAAEKRAEKAPISDVYALVPDDFHGVIPKLILKEGDKVKAGTPVFFDKADERVKFASPVSGEVAEIVRGEKRKILEIRILPDREISFEERGKADLSNRQNLIQALCEGGAWPLIKQRPFDVAANPSDFPKAIVVTGFDSSPMAPDPDFAIEGRAAEVEAGLKALVSLAAGKPVYFNKKQGSSFATKVDGVTVNTFSGPHPAGNVGVQIHAISPINKGETYWTLDLQSTAILGRFVTTGRLDLTRRVALTGSEVATPHYIDMVAGARVGSVTGGQITSDNYRLISGNVLTGRRVGEKGFLGFYHQQITIVPEGNEPKFMITTGWMGPGLDKFSASRAFPTWLMPKSKTWRLDTNQNGEERAFVVTGQYEQVFPFDIYPVQLIKSIITNDLDAMENLGIYEVAPEDFALCEYVCTSKINSQEIIRRGLDEVKRECV
jgi:Na+-transporting NADH:ubiquinone oxidoreductase subunit A